MTDGGRKLWSDLNPAHFAVLVPIYRTLGALMDDVSRWRKRRFQKRMAGETRARALLPPN